MARIRVKQIATGQIGTIPEENYDPTRYEMVGGENQTMNESTNAPPASETSPAPASTGGGLNLEKLIGTMALGNSDVLNDITKYKTALSLINPKKTATETQLEMQKAKGNLLNKQLDSLGKDWNKMNFLERIIPGAGKVSAARAKFDTARDAYTLQLNSMVADKRISDKERDYYRRLFPSPLMTKAAAKARIDLLKEFVTQYNSMVSPYQTQQGGLDEILNLVQQ